MKPQDKYDRANTVHISLKLNRKTDQDILAALEKTPSKQGYIKTAIRSFLEKKREA